MSMWKEGLGLCVKEKKDYMNASLTSAKSKKWIRKIRINKRKNKIRKIRKMENTEV